MTRRIPIQLARRESVGLRPQSQRSARDIHWERGRGCVCMTRRIPIQLARRESVSPRPQAIGVREIYTVVGCEIP